MGKDNVWQTYSMDCWSYPRARIWSEQVIKRKQNLKWPWRHFFYHVDQSQINEKDFSQLTNLLYVTRNVLQAKLGRWLKSENKNSRMNIILADSSIQRWVWLEPFLTVCALFALQKCYNLAISHLTNTASMKRSWYIYSLWGHLYFSFTTHKRRSRMKQK